MTGLVAILTLTTLAAPAAAASHAPATVPAAGDAAAPLGAMELLPLPAVKGRVELRVEPLEAAVTLASPQGAPALARTLRALSRAVCPLVEERPGEVRLKCRSTRVNARLVQHGERLALELRELPGLPAQGDAAMPIVFSDPSGLGLGARCPGSDPAGRGECRLSEGRADLARGLFLTASRSSAAPQRDHALLRLGDLALEAGDAASAEGYWARIESEPWRRMAEVRRCELSVACLVAKGDALFATADLPRPFARELTLRAARVRAFRGDPLGAAWSLAGEFGDRGVCAGDLVLCRRILLAALRLPEEAQAAEALAITVACAQPHVDRLTVELSQVAAEVAARAGAPAFAAALLSGTSGAVAEAQLNDHLLRTAELYVAANDAVRARVVVDFLRTRAGARALAGPRWTAVLRGLATATASSVAPAPAPAVPPDDGLARAGTALARARALQEPTGATP